METKQVNEIQRITKDKINYYRVVGVLFSLIGIVGLIIAKIFPLLSFFAFLISGIIYLIMGYNTALQEKDIFVFSILRGIALIILCIGGIIAYLASQTT